MFKEKKKQVIHCDVKSCKYHNEEDCKCDLDEIKVGSSCNCDNVKDKVWYNQPNVFGRKWIASIY